MTRKILLNGVKLEYELEYKKVKNINLRIRADATVYVSASRRVPLRVIEDFMKTRSDFILGAVERIKNRAPSRLTRYFEDEELYAFVDGFCREIYPYYASRGVEYPTVKFRKMVSRWGSCKPKGGIVTFSKYLAYAPPECVRYVILHEFTHFFEANHGRGFYDELRRVCPDHKELRERMKGIDIRSIDKA